jgi:hypothetical protein
MDLAVRKDDEDCLPGTVRVSRDNERQRRVNQDDAWISN